MEWVNFPVALVSGQSNRTLFLGVFMIIVVSIALYVVYQVFFHPLAKYPGPLLAKFTFVRAGYHAWKGDIHLDMWQCHQKYGPIVRYGPNHLAFNTTSGLRDIYSSKSNTWKPRMFASLSPDVANVLTMHDKNEHRTRRRAIGPAFAEPSVKAFQDRLLHHINNFCTQIDSHGEKSGRLSWGSPMDMSDWCRYLAFDTISDFILGKSYNLLGNKEYRQLSQDIDDLALRNSVLTHLPYLRLGRLDKLLFKTSVAGTRNYWKWVMNALNTRAASETNTVDLYSTLSDSLEREETNGPTSMAVKAEVGLHIVAGLDTTATAIASLLFYICKNTSAQERLATEIREAFDDLQDIRLGSKLKDCAYLQACINESLRMSPPIGSCSWREVGHGGETIDGHAIAEGIFVGTGIYSMHHDAAYFPDPHRFCPERWMVDSASVAERYNHSAFVPFSLGPRSCIGRSLAHAQLSLATAVLLWKYDVQSTPEPENNVEADFCQKGPARTGRNNQSEFQIVDRITSHFEGPNIRFRRRKFSLCSSRVE